MSAAQWNLPLAKTDLTLAELVAVLNGYSSAGGVGGRDGAVGLGPSAWIPPDYGLQAWAFDPISIQAGTILVAGTLNLARLRLRVGTSVSNVVLEVTAAGVGLTSGQCFAGAWDINGALLGLTGDQSGVWNASGMKVMPLTAPLALPPGDVYVGFWANAATTLPTIGRGVSQQATTPNFLSAVTAMCRAASANTGLTTTAPNPFTGITAAAPGWWAGLS